MTRESGARKSTSLATIIVFSAAWLFAEPTGLAPASQTASGQSSTGTVSPVPTPLPNTATQSTHLQIDHDPLACVTTAKRPVVAAKIQPGPELSKSYVFWRAPGDDYFYYSIMEGPPSDVKGVMPRPKPDTTTVEYFVQATDTASLSRKTPEYLPPVVKSELCKDTGMAVPVAGGAGLTIGLTNEKQSPYPRGFNRDDIAAVILVTGAVVGIAAAAAAASGSAAAGGGAAAAGAGTGTGAAGAAGGTAGAAAATGGGLSTAAIVAGGAVAAAGIGYGVHQAVNNSSSTPTPTRSVTVTPTFTPTPVANRFIEVDATWSGLGNVTIQLLRGGLNVSGQSIPGPGCASTGSKTTRFIIQGQNVSNGDYVMIVTGSTCTNAPPQVAAFVSVQTDAGPAPSCGHIVNVPTNGSQSSPYPACTFTLPLH